MGQFSTGIRAVDRRLDGGMSAGSLVAIETPPASQSHTVLRQLIDGHPTLYLTTLRSATAIEDDLEGLPLESGTIRIREVDRILHEENEFVSAYTGSSIRTPRVESQSHGPLDEVFDLLDEIEEGSVIIIDPINPLEQTDDRKGYQRLLRKISDKLRDAGALGVLHSIVLDQNPDLRESTLTFADVVWELSVNPTRRGQLELQMRIPKNRRGKPILEQVTLVLEGQDVYTDDSRNI